MYLSRLRVEVSDHPGRIGRVFAALGRLAVNVVEIDCHTVDGDVRVDDLFVHATRPTDVPAIAHAIENAGCAVIEIRPITVHDLEDPVTRSMRLIAQVATASPLTDDLIAWCAGELVRADLAQLIDARLAPAGSTAAAAMARGVAVLEREWVKRLPSMGVQPWALALPFDRAGRRTAAVVYRTTSPFTRTETARLRTLLEASSRDVTSAVADAPIEVHEHVWDHP